MSGKSHTFSLAEKLDPQGRLDDGPGGVSLEFRYVPPKYSAATGAGRDWEDDARIVVDLEGDGVLIAGNKAGLILLAKHLLTLAQPDVPVHCHFHYDPGTYLEDESLGLIIGQIAEGE